MESRRALAELAANLACRRRLGLGRVCASPQDLDRLLALAGPGRGLAAVRSELGECTRCDLSQSRRHIVFGDGPAHAALMLIGEGPGAAEDARGLPFVGPAGKLLERMLAAVGLSRGEVYITNIVKCRPPHNREPRAEEVAACFPFLKAQVKTIMPQAICTLGRPAAQTLLDSEAPMGALRGKWADFQGVPLLPTYHPAYLLRSPARKASVYQDLKELARALKRARGA